MQMNLQKSQSFTLFVLAWGSFLVGFDAIVTVPLLPEIMKSIGIPKHFGGYLYASYAITYALFAPIFGNISDQWDRKKFMILGLIGFGFGTACTGFGQSFLAFLMFRIITGLGAAMIQPNIYAMIGDTFSYEERGKAMGIVTAALISSSIIGVPIAGFIADHSSWQWAFWLISILALGVVVLAALFFSSSNKPRETSMTDRPRSFGSIFHPSIFLTLLVSLLYYGGLQGMFVLIGVYYNQYFGLRPENIGYVLMFAGFGSVIGSIMGGKAADRWTKAGVVQVAGICVSVMVFSLSLTTKSLWLAIGIHFLWAFFYGVGQSAFTAFVSELHPQARGLVLSFNSSAMYIGAGVLSGIASLLLKSNHFFHIGILCAGANILVAFLVRRLAEVEKIHSQNFKSFASH
jgi:predicted MFS family arabinose efflux permease